MPSEPFLEWDVMVPDKELRSTVSMGIVTLEGDVALWSERMDAERAIERLAGVKAVVNKVHVKPAPLDAAELRAAVQKALVSAKPTARHPGSICARSTESFT